MVQIRINELCCWQGDSGPKGLKGLKGAAGFKVKSLWGKTFNSIYLIGKQQAATRETLVGAEDAVRAVDGWMVYFKAALQRIKWDQRVFSDYNLRVFVVHLEELEKLGNKEKL